MRPPYILVIDTGSSSMRGLLTDAAGTIVFSRQLPYFMRVAPDGSARQDSAVYRECLTGICRAAAEECLLKGYSLEAVALTSPRSSVLPLDAEGEPLGPIITWYDKGSAPLCESIGEARQKEIYRICGYRPTPVLSAPKMCLLKRERPELYHASCRLAGIHDYLLYLCTGRFVTDLTCAGKTGLLDIRTGAWSEELLDFWGIEPDRLCEIVTPGSVVGPLTGRFARLSGLPAGLPVLSAGGDQQCSMVGQKLLYPGRAGITSGTASYTAMLTDEPVFDPQMRVNVLPSCLAGKYMLETGNLSSGAVYRWVKETLYPAAAGFPEMNEDIARSCPGANGLLILPDFAGKGCPEWDDFRRASVHNLNLSHTRGDFGRAVLEGIGAEIAECVKVLEECGNEIGLVTSAGGLSRFPLFNGIIADMIDHPVSACACEETTGIGAWAVAAAALSIYEDPAAALEAGGGTGEEENVVYLPDHENTELYRKQALIRAYLRDGSDSGQLHDMFRNMWNHMLSRRSEP